MNRDDVLKAIPDSELNELLSRTGDHIYVVMNEAGSSVVRNPGTGQPFSTPIKQRAEQVALESGGHALTWSEAFAQLNRYYREHPNG